MTSGVAKGHELARCGCCDMLGAAVICERCQEPMCARNMERVQRDGETSWVCTICREAIDSETMQAAPAVGAA